MSKLASHVLMVVALVWSTSSLAAFVEYSDRVTWDDAADVLTGGGWELYITGSNGVGNWDGTDGINDDITFTNLQTGLPPLIFADTFVGSNGSLSLGSGKVVAAGDAGMRIDFPASNGFALDLRGYFLPVTTFQITLSTGDAFSTTVTNPVGGF